MIVCIFGPSFVGKTTIAGCAAAALDLPLRSCGHAVRQMAEILALPIDQLTDNTHRAVDAATVEWALERRGGCIIEGHFLDAVFAAAGVPAILIGLQADRGRRVERARRRTGRPAFSSHDLDRLDAEDAAFRGRLFGRHASDLLSHILDTSDLSADECAGWVQETIKASGRCRKNLHD